MTDIQESGGDERVAPWPDRWEPCNDHHCNARNGSYPIFVKTKLTPEYVKAFQKVAQEEDIRYRYILDVDPTAIIRQLHDVEDDADVDLDKHSEWIQYKDKGYEHDLWRHALRRDGLDQWQDHFVHFTFLIVDDACITAGTSADFDGSRHPIAGYGDAVYRAKDSKGLEPSYQIIVCTNAPDSTDDIAAGPWKSRLKLFRVPFSTMEYLPLVERLTQTPTMWFEGASYAHSFMPPLELSHPEPSAARQMAWSLLSDMSSQESSSKTAQGLSSDESRNASGL